MNMTSNKPYLIKAIYEWIVDNKLTPYVSVDAHQPGVEVPQSYATRDGEIVLNLSPRAVPREPDPSGPGPVKSLASSGKISKDRPPRVKAKRPSLKIVK